jgi:hypothetical protein
MSTDKQLLVFLLLGLIVIFVMCSCKAKNEKYQDVNIPYGGSAYTQNELVGSANNALFAQPGFKANLDPRFDANQGEIWGQSAPYAMRAAPITPVSFAEMGGNMPTKMAMPSKMPSKFVEPTELTAQQAAQALDQAIGTTTPKFQEANELMPTPDMLGAMTLDPTDPKNFMYDRTIFAKLKRRYGNGVDFFRGDIQIPQEKRGWFDIRPPQENDIVTGYFDNYIDIQQQTSIKDSVFERTWSPEEKKEDAVNIYGNTRKLVYDML